jgi:hypothetical protein
MPVETQYYEVQKKSPIWVYFIVITTNALMLFAVYQHIIMGLNDKLMTTNTIIMTLSVVVVALINVLLFSLRLEILIRPDGIRFRYFPMQRKFRYYPFDSINKCYVRKFRPIAEYGGWGMRGFGNNRSFTVSGNMGMQIVLKNGSKTLIGTHKPEELGLALEKLGFNKL